MFCHIFVTLFVYIISIILEGGPGISRIYIYFLIVFCLFLVFPLPNWSVSIGNATTTSIRFSWQNLQTLIGQQISHYFVVVKNSYGSSLNSHIVSGNTTSHVFYGLSVYREYRLFVVGVNNSGGAYNSTESSAWTDEGGRGIIKMLLFFFFSYISTYCRYRQIASQYVIAATSNQQREKTTSLQQVNTYS